MNVVIYTAVFGGYDTLEPSKFQSVCLTDGSVPIPPKWKQELVLGLQGPKHASRYCKILAHELFPTADYSIYIDGSASISISPEQAIDKFLLDSDIAVFPHPDRPCVYDEGEAVIRFRKAKALDVELQLARYVSEGYPRNNGLANCCVVIRKHTSEIEELNNLWWQEYLVGAPRDQLSFDYACWKLGIIYDKITPGNPFTRDCPYFTRIPHRRK